MDITELHKVQLKASIYKDIGTLVEDLADYNVYVDTGYLSEQIFDIINELKNLRDAL